MLLPICFLGVTCGKDGSVNNHMEMGKKLLAAGQLADALSHFHAAVGEDTLNILLVAVVGNDPYISNHLSLAFSPMPQTAIRKTTWPTTAEPQCFWQWGSQSLRCPIWEKS